LKVASQAGVDEVAVIEQHLRANAAAYWTGVRGDVTVHVRPARRRAASRHYAARLSWSGGTRSVVVKVAVEYSHGRTPDETPPRLWDYPAPATRSKHEYQALRRIERHLTATGDPRFRPLRALDHIEPIGGLILEQLEGQTLRSLLRRASRLDPRPAPRKVWGALEETGAWLRMFRDMPVEGALVLRPERADFIALARRFCDYLGKYLDGAKLPVTLADELESAAGAMLDEQLPLAAAHGDFAHDNVLIDRGRVVVLDTCSRWQAPIYEDIAYFLVGLRNRRIQVLTLGAAFSPAQLESFGQAFLRGYFGSPETPTALRLYEVLLLLEKWAAEVARSRRGGSGRALARPLVNAWYRTQLRRAMAAL
jgi:hypothetical protein